MSQQQQQPERILLTGVTGKIGQHLVKELLSRSQTVQVRLYARDVAKATQLHSDALDGHTAKSQIEIAAGTNEDAVAFNKALEGVDRLFLLSNDFVQEVEQAKLAKSAGVKHIVRISCIKANIGYDYGTFIQQHGQAELDIAALGVPVTFLRPHDFMDNSFNDIHTIKTQKAIYSNAGDAAISSVHSKDIAASAAGVLLAPIDLHAGIGYTLTGPEALTKSELAAKFSKHLIKTINLVPVDETAVYQSLLPYIGSPRALRISYLGVLYREFLSGGVRFTTGWVKFLSGRDPITWDEFIAENKDKFE